MLDYSDEESSANSTNSSNESEIIIPSKTRQRSLLDEIKENPDLYTTRRSERNRKEPSRFNILSERGSHSNRLSRKIYSGSTSDDNNDDEDEDSDFVYSKRNKKYNYKQKMEFRKRTNVSYKEVVTSDDDVGGSDDSEQPKKKVQKLNDGHGFANVRDNPLLNKPTILIRGGKIEQNISNDGVYDDSHGSDYICEELNVIEEVLNYRLGIVGNTGMNTSYYNRVLKNAKFMNDEGNEAVMERQYLIKWREWSHIHSTWESENSVLSFPNIDGMKKLLKFKEIQKQREIWKKHYASPEDLDAAQFEEERNETLLQQKMECERIIDAQINKSSDSIDYLIKWKTLDYRYSTWESGEEIVNSLFPDAIVEFEERSRSAMIPNRKCEALTRRPKFAPIREQPAYLSSNPDMKLRDYQLDGVNWLAHAWTRGNSVILADEMGLGKTIQTIGMLSYLFNQHSIYGPFLLVVPLSTISSWQTEFNIWAPYLNVIIYTGDAVSRQVIRECEWYFPKKKMLKFHVCITTYELVLKDKDWLNKISWAFLGVDEAHRLKNDESQLYNFLITFDTNTRLLITGTPVHNSLRELWALLHFIMPDKFNTWPDFEERYNITNENRAVEEVVSELYKVLEPFLLRRTKKDVEKSLPSKSEQIIRVPMCRKQTELYKLILTKNYEALSKETRGHTSSFLNIVMELKKCCNHIQLVNPIDEETEFRMDPDSRLRYYIKSSGKMMLLDKLMFELKEKGHRVLIFSQMVRMLDIISDYLVLRGWGFQRLDGSIKGSLRKQAIDHFNAEGSTDFCFLLSTRAGGLGINLATADTVIIFDSDWNPQNDLQAMARAHRIGQKRQVSVYRFVIKNSIEEKIIECAKRKMVLDHLVIQRMDSALHRKTDANKNQPFSKDELNEILKFGAADLFNQDEELDEDQELNIHDILQRAETRDNDDESHNPANDLLSAFKVVNITETAEDEDIVYIGHKGKPKLWSDIVPQDIREKIKEEEHQKALLELELGPRQRKKVKAYQVGQVNTTSTDESSEEEDKEAVVGKLTDKEVKSIIKVMKKFPRPLERIQSIMVEAEIIDHSEKEVYDVMKQIITGCHVVFNECDTEEKKNKAVFTIRKIIINVKNLLQSVEDLDILHVILPKNKDDRLKFELPFETKLANWSCMWETEDDARLLVGVFERGLDNWEAIKMDPDLKLTCKILPSSVTERPQASHLRTRVEYLLKKLRDTKAVIKPESTVVKKITKPNKPDIQKKSKVKPKVNHVINPKSAEFVESSDNSSKESFDPKSKSKNKSKSNNKSKSFAEHLKHRDNKSRVSEDPENLFYEMQGPLFDKCTKKMKPIKSKLKFLEDMQRRNPYKIKIDDKQLCDCLLGIGNHIRSVILNFDNGEEKRQWRNYLWSFVNFFFDVFPKETLHRIYKGAYKKSSESKTTGKDSSNNNNNVANNSNSNQHGGSKNDSFNNKSGDNSAKEVKFQSDKVKCNFEARSYQEYIKMKNWNGETTTSSSSTNNRSSNNYNRSEKFKPYHRSGGYNDDNNGSSSRSDRNDNNNATNNNNNNKSSSSHKSSSSYHHDRGGGDDRSDFDRNRKSCNNNNNNNNFDHSQNNYKSSSKSGANFSRDPRLSKSTTN